MPTVTVTTSYLRDEGITLIYDPDGHT